MTPITPIHPGEILVEESLEPLEISQNRLAVALGVPPRRINEIVHGKRQVTADTALRLSRCLGRRGPSAPAPSSGSTGHSARKKCS
ncbi:MAG: HigA family addiction module antitoxin [Micropruina sp.]|nr:HigA family addiction module antidote protein [Micropruina sp.]